jgi:hypothetical protein
MVMIPTVTILPEVYPSAKVGHSTDVLAAVATFLFQMRKQEQGPLQTLYYSLERTG